MSISSLILVVAVLIVLLALLMLALLIRVLLRTFRGTSKSPSNSSSSSSTNVKIITKGRSGSVQYFEKEKTCEFYWEFGAGDMMATVWFPTEEKWNAAYPWAVGRRKEIMDFVAEETRKQMAKSSSIKWEDDRFHLMTG